MSPPSWVLTATAMKWGPPVREIGSSLPVE